MNPERSHSYLPDEVKGFQNTDDEKEVEDFEKENREAKEGDTKEEGIFDGSPEEKPENPVPEPPIGEREKKYQESVASVENVLGPDAIPEETKEKLRRETGLDTEVANSQPSEAGQSESVELDQQEFAERVRMDAQKLHEAVENFGGVIRDLDGVSGVDADKLAIARETLQDAIDKSSVSKNAASLESMSAAVHGESDISIMGLRDHEQEELLDFYERAIDASDKVIDKLQTLSTDSKFSGNQEGEVLFTNAVKASEAYKALKEWYINGRDALAEYRDNIY